MFSGGVKKQHRVVMTALKALIFLVLQIDVKNSVKRCNGVVQLPEFISPWRVRLSAKWLFVEHIKLNLRTDNFIISSGKLSDTCSTE